MAKDCKHYSPGELMDTGGRFVRISECLYVRNGRIYGTKTVDGKMVRKAAPMQGLEAIDARGNPTAAVKKWVRLWSDQVERQEDFADRKRVRVPSFAEVLEAYPQLAAVERASSGKPQEVTVSVASAALRRILRYAGVRLDAPVSDLTEARLATVQEEMVARSLKPVSLFAQFAHCRSVFAAWVMPKYRLKGWEFTAPPFPRRRGRLTNCYTRPPEELRQRTLEWYRSLEQSEPMTWVAASCMLQFGMRNSDVLLLRWEAFERVDDHWEVSYRPGKTAGSSGRMVHVPLSDDLYQRLRRAGGKGDKVVEDCASIFVRINLGMRNLGWQRPKYEKGAYELRKMCIDRIYREFGAEAAVQVSGDNITTVVRYYADSSRACSKVMDW